MTEQKPGSLWFDSDRDAYKQKRAASTASRIVEAANQLLASNQPVSNEAIAEIANVSISSIYRYYENRGDLFSAMFKLEATKTFNRIAGEIERLTRDNHKEIFRNIIAISARAVSGDTFAQLSTNRNIDYDTAFEVNIGFIESLCDKLVERTARLLNCHPESIDRNLITLLARFLVSIPRITLTENPQLANATTLFDELVEAAGSTFMKVYGRAGIHDPGIPPMTA
jgi:AcrR family transcriptional regulator